MAEPGIDSSAPNANASSILGIFAKAWDEGKVKTRLAKTLGHTVAAGIYFELLTMHLLRFACTGHIRVLAYSPADEATRNRFNGLINDLSSPGAWDLVPQVESDLGSRMSCFFEQQFDSNPDSPRVVLIGSDAPQLSTQLVDQAFELLGDHDVVYGPSTDGGYYLVGLSVKTEAIFKGVQWSTEQVLQQSLDICKREGLSVAQLPPLTDIDHEEDLNKVLPQLDRNDEVVASFFERVEPLLKRSS